MNKFDRIQQLHTLLTNRRTPVSLVQLMEEMECKEATVKRLIGKFRHELGARIVYNREQNGYQLERDGEVSYEIPGLWFSVAELQSLLLIHDLLEQLQPGLLKTELSGFKERIRVILSAKGVNEDGFLKRLRLCGVASRAALPTHFNQAARATFGRFRIRLNYYGRAGNSLTTRVISPQRIVHYRDNWYLDGWCHTRHALRTFSVDRIRGIELLDEAAKEISEVALDNNFTSSYGLFDGAATAVAVLRFTPERSRWIADEMWHPDQTGEWLEDGSFILRLPYSDHRELILDILKYGPDVEVLEPKELKEEVKRRLRLALEKYSR